MHSFYLACPSAENFPGYVPVAFLVLHLITPASAGGTVSISAFTSYIVQQLCIKDCFWDGQVLKYDMILVVCLETFVANE
jgi:hypothetical protein